MNLCKNLKLHRLVNCCMRNIGAISPYSTRSSSLTNKKSFVLEPLRQRELIRVHGAEVVPFLQGLVTNDVSPMQHPDGPPSMYALFLNRGGRVLYDTIIYRTSDPGTFLLECDREASADFRRHLRTFRVRKRIDIDTVDDEYVPWVFFDDKKIGHIQDSPLVSELFVAPDPRLPALGTRVLAPTSTNWSKLVKGFWRHTDIVATSATPDNNYQLLRYKQGVGEGVAELPPGKCFPLEANADFLNGVSFHKGCYVGQELTARVHHSGVIRKRYMPVRLTAPVKSQTVKSVAGANLGRIIGHAGNHGVALLRIENVLNGQQELLVDGERCFAEKPQWWPSEMPHKRRTAVCE